MYIFVEKHKPPRLVMQRLYLLLPRAAVTSCSSSVVAEEPAAAMEFISWAAFRIWATSSGFSGESAAFGGMLVEVVVVAVLVAFIGVEGEYMCEAEEEEEAAVLFRSRHTV